MFEIIGFFLKTKKLRLIRIKMNKSEHNFIFDIKFLRKIKHNFKRI